MPELAKGHHYNDDYDNSDILRPSSSDVIAAKPTLLENESCEDTPRVYNARLSLVPKPNVLHSVEELKSLIELSGQPAGMSNFADLSMPRRSARTPVFPTFTRFASTKFASAELGTFVVVKTSHAGSCALYDMSYPITLAVTDSRRISLPGLPLQGIPDSKGYPLLYNFDLPRQVLKARSSGVLYPVNLTRTLATKMTSVPDSHMLRTWAHMFLLSNEDDARSLIMQRVMGPGAGDNHIALLLKAYLAYFDSIVGALEGVIPARHSFSSTGIVINATIQHGWLKKVLESSVEIVNVLGGTPGYQEFWAYCCFDRPPLYAAKTSPDGVRAASYFSHYSLGHGMSMVCICDCDAYSGLRPPGFFGKPNLVLEYIETYVRKFGLEEQANEALQIAMLWPTLMQLKAPITLPKPHHTADWLGAEVDQLATETAYSSLIASNPFLVLASTLAGSWALRSQIYDYVTLLASERKAWRPSLQVMESCAGWLVNNASAPGVGWDFLLRHQFHITPSFLYLTGLAFETTEWAGLLAGFSWDENQFPAHLRLLQPFWVKTSVCCELPWEETWTPQITMSGNMLTADPATIMRLFRLGLLRGKPDRVEKADYSTGVHTIVDWKGKDTIRISRDSLFQLQTALQYGIRVLALSPHFGSQESTSQFVSHDPADSRWTKEMWSIGGLQQNIRLQDRGGDALKADEVSHRDPGLANPKAVTAATARLACVKSHLANVAVEDAAKASSILTSRSLSFFSVTTPIKVPPTQVKVLYSPRTRGDCGWWCVLYIMRALGHDQRSMACLRQQVARAAGTTSIRPGMLSPEEMAGVCAVLQLPVRQILSSTKCMSCKGNFESTLAHGGLQWMLRLENSHWELVAGADFDEVPLNYARSIPVNTNNMPEHCPCHYATFQHDKGIADETAADQDDKGLFELPHNVVTKVRALDNMIQRWDNRLVSTDEVVRMHRRLFPNAGIPRFLTESHDPLQKKTQCQNIKTPDLHSHTNAIEQFLTERCGPEHQSILSNFRNTYAGQQEICEKRWPYRSPETAGKSNISLADLLSSPLDVTIPQESLAIWFIMTRQSNHTEFVTSVGLWLAGVDLCNAAWSELLLSGLLEKNEDTWLEHAKQLHDTWRKSGLQMCSCVGCWTRLLYTQSLWGRGGVDVDWEREITSKASIPDDILAYTGRVWSAEYASQIIRETVREVLSTSTDRLLLRTFDDFIDQAYEWLVSGSAAGMPSAFKNTAVLEKLRHEYHIAPRPTKRSVMERIPREHILKQLQSRPQIIAKLHQKLNETGGKARAIYGVTLWHYIFSNWLMAPFEKAIDHPNIDINIRNDKFLAIQVRRAQEAKQGACFSSYDYPDFNSMHTHYHMSLIYEEAAAVARTSKAMLNMAQAEVDLIMRGFKWLEESVYTQACFLPGPNTFIQTVGGLYSGNRDTTLINTVLNIAYAKVVDVSCMAMGLNPTVSWRLCHGDDIISIHDKYGAALGWNAVAAKAKLKGQEKKLLTDRSYHEYLRIMGCPDGKLRGSLARVVATFVNGNWESDFTAGPHSNLVELEATFGVLERRGLRASFAKKLRTASIRRLVGRIKGDDLDAVQLKDALISLATSDEDVGGREKGNGEKTPGMAAYAANDARKDVADMIYAEVRRREKDEIERLFRDLPDEVTRPYQEMLIAALPVELQQQDHLRGRLKRLLQKSTYGTEMPKRLQVETKQAPQLLTYRDKLEVAKVKRGKYVRPVDMADVERIVGKHKIFATTVRRIKAFHTVLSALDNTGGYSKSELVAHLCKTPVAVVRDVLVTEGLLSADWRRMSRQSAPEVGALENELEMYLTGDGTIDMDEEVVLYAEDGHYTEIPVRDLMLY